MKCHPHLQCSSIPQPLVFKCPWGIYWTPNSSWSCILGVGTQMTGYFSHLKGKQDRWMHICNLKRFGKVLNDKYHQYVQEGRRSRYSYCWCSLEEASCLSAFFAPFSLQELLSFIQDFEKKTQTKTFPDFPERPQTSPENSIKEEHRLVEHICSLYFISTRL